MTQFRSIGTPTNQWNLVDPHQDACMEVEPVPTYTQECDGIARTSASGRFVALVLVNSPATVGRFSTGGTWNCLVQLLR
jgi:hypothetical protein